MTDVGRGLVVNCRERVAWGQSACLRSIRMKTVRLSFSRGRERVVPRAGKGCPAGGTELYGTQQRPMRQGAEG